MDDRAQLRRRMRTARRALTPHQQRQAAEALVKRLLRLPAVRRARRVALYLPNDGEIDPTGLIAPLHARGTRLALPLLAPLGQGRLWFLPWQPGEPLSANRFGIPEPACSRRRRLPDWHLDLVLLPLVAFDANGNRLGMGGGFYDRTFARLASRRHWRRPRLIGIAHHFQQTDALPQQPWDVPLDAVVTDRALHPISRSPHP